MTPEGLRLGSLYAPSIADTLLILSCKSHLVCHLLLHVIRLGGWLKRCSVFLVTLLMLLLVVVKSLDMLSLHVWCLFALTAQLTCNMNLSRSTRCSTCNATASHVG